MQTKKVAALVYEKLAAKGRTVKTCHDVEKGLRLASHQAYDALVLAIMVSGRDGLSFFAAQRTAHNTVPVIRLTSRLAAAHPYVAHSQGAVPKFFSVVLRCKATELGYAVVAEIAVVKNENNGPGGSPVSATRANATNADQSNWAGFSLMPFGAITLTDVAPTKWRLVFRART